MKLKILNREKFGDPLPIQGLGTICRITIPTSFRAVLGQFEKIQQFPRSGLGRLAGAEGISRQLRVFLNATAFIWDSRTEVGNESALV